jgi:uncharacterized membrane protein
MNPVILPLILGGAAIAGTTFLFDRVSGRRRHSQMADDAMSSVEDETRGVGRGLSARMARFRNGAQGLFGGNGNGRSDEAVARRVRATVRGTVEQPAEVCIEASDGRILLHGDVLSDEHESLLRAVRAQTGVSEVTDYLSEGERANGNGPSVSEDGRPSQWRRQFNVGQERWPLSTRLLTGAVGLALIANTARRRSPLGFLGGAVGSSLLLRSATNTPLKRMNRGHGVVDVHKSIVINAPVERVFSLIDAFENFPSFMRNVREVRRYGDGRSRWVVSGPAGSTISWDAITTVNLPNELLAWKTAAGSKVEHSGVIRFVSLENNRTRLDIRMSYNPPAGPIGHAIARIFSADPDSEIGEDLNRLKRVAESWDAWKGRIEAGREESRSARSTRRRPPASEAEGGENRVS